MKDYKVTARINKEQNKALQKIISEGKTKTIAAALQYLINIYMIKGE